MNTCGRGSGKNPPDAGLAIPGPGRLAEAVNSRRTFFSSALSAALGAVLLTACATHPPLALHEPTVVEASCGECQFGLKGKSCDLAIRVHGRAYFVDGVKLDDLGDAHAADGLCQCIRMAKVTGEVRGGRFVASSFKLEPASAK